jgi:hypothetical protein
MAISVDPVRVKPELVPDPVVVPDDKIPPLLLKSVLLFAKARFGSIRQAETHKARSRDFAELMGDSLQRSERIEVQGPTE